MVAGRSTHHKPFWKHEPDGRSWPLALHETELKNLTRRV
jgi:hypothetical protein